MGASEELRRMEIRLAAKSNNKQIINMNRQYYLYSLNRGVTAYSPSYGSVGSFLVHFVAQQKGSSKSVANILSNLRVLCARADVPWLSPSDMVRISQLIRQLKLDDAVEVKRKDPLLKSIIRKALANHWRVKESMSDFLAATITLVGHDGVLRGDELFNNLKVKDVQWYHEGHRKFILHIGRPEQPGKTARTGSGINQDIWDYPGACAYKFLATWFDLHNLWDKPEAYIFPRIQKSYQDQSVQLYFTEPVSKKWYEHQLANMLHRLGLDSSQYSVHSLRAGGATDLFNAGTPIAQIQHYGRWATLTALIYYRDRLGYVGFNCAMAFGTGRYRGEYDY